MSPSPLIPILAPSPPAPRRGLNIPRTPARRIRTRPHHRRTRAHGKRRTRHHTLHHPRTPRHMRRHAARGPDLDSRRVRPRAGPDRRAGDDVFRGARGGGRLCFLGLGGAVDLVLLVGDVLEEKERGEAKAKMGVGG
jgi:hypothetical protein